MASATGIPQRNHAHEETEPLLGQPGDVTQGTDEASMWNILSGTAALAQGGIWVLTAIVWAAVFEHDVMFFSFHPLTNSAGLLLLVQAILFLQPTATQKQKVRGTYIHSILNLLALAAFISGLVIIEMNKASHPETRFQSTHGKVGLVVYILIYIQVLVGIAQFYFPSLLGGVDRAKSIYKYHRMSGYAILVGGLVTICLAVSTPFNQNVLHIRLWAVVTTSVLVLVGIVPRIKKSKFGF